MIEARMAVLRGVLRVEAEDLCREVSDTPLPPLQVRKHVITSMDKQKIYNFHPSRCPEALKPQFETRGAVQAESEHIPEDLGNSEHAGLKRKVMQPPIAGLAAAVSAEDGLNSEAVVRNPARAGTAPTRYDPEIPGVIDSKGIVRQARKGEQKAAGREASVIGAAAQLEYTGTELPGASAGNGPEGERSIDHNDQSDPLNITQLVSEIDVIEAIRNGCADHSHFSSRTNYDMDVGVEFAINPARSETTGFATLVLNYGLMPRPMLARTFTGLLGD
ncbi:hypothetical protein FRC10_000457, partial [Ceratobasidium sp. 414]